jgi:glycogen debranching enzyme
LTENGLATENLKSPLYEPDGYWLGPIWAPSTMVIAESLEEVGEKEFARELRLRFCKLVAKNGISENFDAITGAGLRDPAYTWTSSVFLIFAHELLQE